MSLIFSSPCIVCAGSRRLKGIVHLQFIRFYIFVPIFVVVVVLCIS